MGGLHERMDSTKTFTQESVEQPKTVTRRNGYPFATFNTKMQQEDDDPSV